MNRKDAGLLVCGCVALGMSIDITIPLLKGYFLSAGCMLVCLSLRKNA